MSTCYPGEPMRACPRCHGALQPGQTGCSSCGFQLAYLQPDSTIQSARPPLSSNTAIGRPRASRRGALLYFTSVLLFIVVFAFVMLRAAGISLSTFFSQATPPSPTSTYGVPAVSPLFSDGFSSDASGWNLQDSPGNYAVTIGNGALTLEIDKQSLLWELLPGQRSYGDLTLTVNAVLARGDQNNGYGIYIRGASNQGSDLATYYRFEVYGDGSYAIFKGSVDSKGASTSTKIVDDTLSPAIQKQGQVNHLMIIARGAALSLIVNGQLLKTITDHSYTSGSVALFVSNLPQARPGVEVQFSQFAIYPVQA